jgi:hypothetical protein
VDKGKKYTSLSSWFPYALCKKVRDSTACAHIVVNFTAPGTAGNAGECVRVPASQLEVLSAGPDQQVLLTAERR